MAETLCTRSSSSEDLKFFRGADGSGREGHVIASIHVIPPTESTETTLLAISNLGFRFYLSAWPSQRSYGASAGVAGTGRPRGLFLRHLRRPPSRALCAHLLPSRRDEELQKITFNRTSASTQLAITGTTSDGEVSEVGAFTSPITFNDFEATRRATGGTSRYATPPGAPITKTLYSNRSLLIVSSASSVPSRSGSLGAEGDTCRLMGFCEDTVAPTERGGARATFTEEVCLVKGFPTSPPFGELLEHVSDLVDQPVGSNIGLYKLALISSVPKSLVQQVSGHFLGTPVL